MRSEGKSLGLLLALSLALLSCESLHRREQKESSKMSANAPLEDLEKKIATARSGFKK